MNTREALSILGLSKEATSDQIKIAYKKACSKYHPDRNAGGLEMMKAVNVAYAHLSEIGYDGSVNAYEGEETQANFGDDLMNAINAVIDLEGIVVEVCGVWVWLSGDTYPHKDAIKSAGYHWAGTKKQWYFAGIKSTNKKGSWDMDTIRAKHGSLTVAKKEYKKIAA